jgi:tetratricopeptide (TPR) repeat protein
MAYIKMKDYRKAIDDANTALEMKPGYLKAFHRRGKAYAALNEHDLAIKDFQTILESEPENKEVNKDLMAARTLLNDKILKEIEKENKKKGKSKGSSKNGKDAKPKET